MGRGHTEFPPLLAPAPVTRPSEIDLESGTEEQIQCRICLESDGRGHICVMGRGYTEFPPLLAPAPVTKPSEIDLESGTEEQIQCRICLESDGRDFIAPCKCKGTSKYVHRACLNHWRAVKEGFAFAHCTTCKAPYYLIAANIPDRRCQTLKFRFFVTRDIAFIFLVIQMVIALLAYLVYLIDGSQKFRLRLTCGFGSELSFYYICGTVLFFALLGLSGCFITCSDQRIHNDPALPCRELHHCCCDPGMCADCQLPRALNLWSRESSWSVSCNCASCECACCDCDCDCLEGNHEAGLSLLFILAIIAICLFAVFGIVYFILVVTMIGQRIWQRHYHILAKRKLTEEYIVEDVNGEINEATWSPPPLTPDNVQQLKALGLL